MKQRSKSNPPLANTNNKSNPHDQNLANTCAPKIQKKKKKQSIAKANLFNQIAITSNAEQKINLFNQITITSNTEEKINLFNVQHKKKKKSIEKAKGMCIVEPSNNNTEHMVFDQAQFKDDILMEILYRLPVRYLVQFKCVSKSWMALISDPYFVKKHLNHAKNDPHSQKFLFYQSSRTDNISSMYSCPLSSVQLVDNVQKLDCPSGATTVIYCSYNGLAIIRAVSPASSIHMLWNPSTRESIVLPEPEFPLQGSYCLGLGYDSTTGDYKILKIHNGSCVGNKIHGSKVPGEILALKSGSWRNIDKHPRGINSYLDSMGFALAFVNDAFHWICVSGNYLEASRTCSLISFSISNELQREIPLPEQILRLKNNNTIGASVLDGMLCAYSTYDHQCKRTFKLWVLKDYGINESWNTLFIIDDELICRAVPKYWFADGEVLLWSLYWQGKLTHSFRTSRGRFGICDAIQDGFAFTESLISPKSLI